MRVLVVGGTGLLGTDVVRVLSTAGHEVWAPPSSDFDVTDSTGMVLEYLEESKTNGAFKWCVNCSAYTAVDRAESEVEAATALNVVGPTGLAALCKEQNVRLIHISTDFVFDGAKREPYTESDAPNPLNVYGGTKLTGENGVISSNRHSIVLRTSWLFGASGPCFPKSIVRAWLAGKDLRVVHDQVGSPTSCLDLASTICWVMENSAPGGVYHAAGPEAMSWHRLAELSIDTYRRVHAEAPSVPEIQAIATADWPTVAERPLYSVLDSSKLALLGAPAMGPVSDSLTVMWNQSKGCDTIE